MSDKNLKYWVGFSLIPGIGHVRLTQLENYFGELEKAWRAGPADLKQSGLNSGSIRAITSWRPKLSLDAEMEIQEIVPASDTESLLLKQLSAGPAHIDELCRSTGLSVSEISSTLAVMELKGMVKQVGNMNYVLAREAREAYRVKVD
ncbi:MAG: ArsR family transcriptional regulator [Dehalococcoidia bacterium]|nr:MAG: ArsR family transcriptional regulator [Dehalococcoidia bacterium]